MKMTITYEGTPKELAEYTKSALPNLEQNDAEKIVKEKNQESRD